MSESMRAQLSLNFYDEELYSNLIIPLKSSKELKPVVHRLLSAYYYNMDVRRLVDGLDDSDLYSEEQLSRGLACEEAFKQARETLAMMSILSDSAHSVVDSGIGSISEAINDDSDIFSTSQNLTESILSLPNKIDKNNSLLESKPESKEAVDYTHTDGYLDDVRETLKEQSRTMENLIGLVQSLSSSVSRLSDEVQHTKETQSLSPTNVVVNSFEDKEVVLPKVVEDAIVQPEEDVIIVEEEPNNIVEEVATEKQDEVIDGSDSLKAFLDFGVGFSTTL